MIDAAPIEMNIDLNDNKRIAVKTTVVMMLSIMA